MAEFVEAAKQDQPPPGSEISANGVFVTVIDDHGFGLNPELAKSVQE